MAIAFSYNPAETSDLDRVRGRIGDTLSNDPLLDDNTISAVLAIKGGVLPAACECIQRVIARLARNHDKSVGGGSSSRSQVVDHFEMLLDRLKAEMMLETQPFVGGISEARQAELESDTDFKQPAFKVGMDDKPGVLPPTQSTTVDQ